MNAETNKKKFEMFFRTEYNKLLNFVRKNIDDRFFGSTPEDIIQDVALSFLSKLDVDQQIENLAGYIYRSIRNKTIDANRQKLIPLSTDDELINKLANARLASIADEVVTDSFDENRITNEQLHESILKLRPDEQAIIMLTEFEGKSFAELSQRWDTPIGTLLSRKHRALSKLNKLLTDKQTIKTIK